jgi:hypothetical protein
MQQLNKVSFPRSLSPLDQDLLHRCRPGNAPRPKTALTASRMRQHNVVGIARKRLLLAERIARDDESPPY